MRPYHWFPLLAATLLTTGCAVYPAAPVAGPPPGVVYDSSPPVAVAPYPYYAAPYPYPYTYAPGWYAPPVFFSGSLAFVHRSGPGFHPGFRGAVPSRPNGLRLLPRTLPGRH